MTPTEAIIFTFQCIGAIVVLVAMAVGVAALIGCICALYLPRELDRDAGGEDR